MARTNAADRLREQADRLDALAQRKRAQADALRDCDDNGDGGPGTPI